MKNRRYKTVDYQATLDVTVRLGDCLPPDHLARFVVDAVAHLDLSTIYARYGSRGGEPYAPEVLLGLLFYSYATGVFASRKIERATYESAPFARRVVFKQPLSSKESSYFVLKTSLESTKLPGALEELSLTLADLTGSPAQQSSFLTEVRRREQLREAVAQLKTYLGGPSAEGPLYQIRMVEPWSRIPERRMALVEYAP